MGGCISLPDYRIRLGAFLPLDDVEFHIIAFFQSLVAIQLNCRVVNENIWPVVASDESVALGVIEPLHFAFELSHRGCLSCHLRGFMSEYFGETPTLTFMTLIRRQRFIEMSEKLHKMGQARRLGALACLEDIESVDSSPGRAYFFPFLRRRRA